MSILIPKNTFVLLELTSHFNNNSISYPDNLIEGNFDVWGNTFPADELPVSQSLFEVGGIPFHFSSKEQQLNNLVCCGQGLDVPPGLYNWLYILGAAERRTEDFVYLHYANGAVEPEWLRISDFWLPAAHFGEIAAFRCKHLHYPRHIQPGMNPVIWQQRIAVPRHEDLSVIRLPDNIAIHIFAVTGVRETGVPQ